MKKHLLIGLAAIAASSISVSSHAAPQLRLSDGINTVTVTDGGAGDASALAGVVIFQGSVGDFLVNVTTGITKPVLGTPADPVLDLNSIDVTGTAGGVLTVEFTETDFFSGGALVNFVTQIGGVTADTVQFEHFASTTNTGFATDVSVFDSGNVSGVIAYADTTQTALTGLYSLTTVATVTHASGGQNSSFNSVLESGFGPTTDIPEPALAPSLLIGGMVLAGRLIGRRRKA
ncbi:MAG: hypothetical protein ACPGRZ_04390 [Alphaproteobacteria bacterium]